MTQELIDIRTFEYLEKRAIDLANYSTRLKDEIHSIVKIFGDRDLCRICGGTQANSDHYKYRAYDRQTLSPSMSYVNDINPDWIKLDHDLDTKRNEYVDVVNNGKRVYWDNKYYKHLFIPKVQLGIGNYTSKEVYGQTNSGADIRLKIKDDELFLKYVQPATELEQSYGDTEPKIKVAEFWNADRSIIKLIVKERAIQRFLAEIKKELDEMTEEYKQVSEIATNLNKAIQGTIT